MVVKTFPASIADGKLRYEEPLSDLEGQQVEVTVVAAEPSRAGGPSKSEAADEECAPPAWMDIEREVFAKLAFPSELVERPRLVDGEPLRPCAIVPEELPDE